LRSHRHLDSSFKNRLKNETIKQAKMTRLEDNIKMGVNEIRWEGVDWIYLVQVKYRWLVLVNTLTKLQIPLKAGNIVSR
jgi:hypothetical protein